MMETSRLVESSESSSTLQLLTPRVFQPLLKRARYKGAYGGRGASKSHYFAESLVEECINYPGTRAVCIRENQKSLEESVKRLIEDKIKTLGVGSLFRVLATHIEAPQGGVIIFRGMQNYTAESIKSLEGYRIAWVEEAQTLSQTSLDLLRPTMFREPDSEIWFSWNPNQPTDPIDKFLRGGEPPPDSIVVNANYYDNPWFPEGLRRDMEYDRRRNPEKYAHVWLGEYERYSESRVFHNWRIEEFETPPNMRFYYGADWGFSVDPTVLVRCYIGNQSKRMLFVDQEAYKIGCEIDDTPELFNTIPDARKWPIRADSARPETISYMKRHGFHNITPALKGKDSVEDGIEFLKSYTIIVHPRCRHTSDELSRYSWKTDR